MSNREAGIYILKTQRSILRGEYRMLSNMLNETPKGDPEHWDMIKQREALQKEMGRISHRLRAV